jgi:catechol 2,3-dioxygenase-like lactoylglutathione lyase family enzyme
MEIRQTRVVLRVRNFERTNRFYEQTLGLPRLRMWEADDGRRALFQLGTAALEIRGRASRDETGGRDEAFDYEGPSHKMTIELIVPSAEGAYEELLLRDRNIPGGLATGAAGTLLFTTHDPDGVKIVFREPAA